MRVVSGGMEAWAAAGYPVIRQGPTTWSLERQVRLTVSILLMGSFLLGRLVNSAFYALTLLIAGGLCFSALTDTCAMAKVLARLPWNRRA